MLGRVAPALAPFALLYRPLCDDPADIVSPAATSCTRPPPPPPKQQQQQPQRPVPLVRSEVRVEVGDVRSALTLVQTYENTSPTEPMEITYLVREDALGFDDTAFLAEFEAELDGRVIRADVRERGEAQDRYDDALAAGGTAALVERATEEEGGGFSARLGNLRPRTACVVRLTFLSHVRFARGGELLCVVPKGVAPQLAVAGDDAAVQRAALLRDGASITVTVELPVAVRGVTSPSRHAISVHRDTDTDTDSGGDARRVRVEWKGAPGETLKADLRLAIEADLPPARGWVQVHPPTGIPVAAMAAVDLRPLFRKVEERARAGGGGAATKEVIFVLDQSGSMRRHGRIDQAKQAMQIFLRSLPEGVRFNVVGFGTRFVKLWPTSRPYGDDTLREASAHITNLQANLGQTKLAAPLADILKDTTRAVVGGGGGGGGGGHGPATKVLRKRPPYILAPPVQPEHTPPTGVEDEDRLLELFVLTDGIVENPEAVFELLRRNQSKARVFSVGLGSGASQFQVREIARIGGGTAEFSGDDGTSLTRKIQRQLALSALYSVAQVRVEWLSRGVPVQAGGVRAAIEGRPVFEGSALVRFALLPPGAIGGAYEDLEARITATGAFGLTDTQTVKCNLVTTDSFLSRMAAHQIIGGLEEGLSAQPQDWKYLPDQAQLRRDIRRLALDHRLASSCTSFVAVADPDPNRPAEPVVGPLLPLTLMPQTQTQTQTPAFAARPGSAPSGTRSGRDPAYYHHERHRLSEPGDRKTCEMRKSAAVTRGAAPTLSRAGAMALSSSAASAAPHGDKKQKKKMEKEKLRQAAGYTSDGGGSCEGDEDAAAEEAEAATATTTTRASVASSLFAGSGPAPVARSSPATATARPAAPTQADDAKPQPPGSRAWVLALAMLQTAGGRWDWQPGLLRQLFPAAAGSAVAAAAAAPAPPEGVDGGVWATALVLASLELRAADLVGEWELIAQKADAWLRSARGCGGDDEAEAIVEQARQAVLATL